VGIEIVLARPAAGVRDRAVRREAGADRVLDGAPIEHRQRSRQAETDRASVAVGWRAEARRAGAEDLRLGEHLGMHLEADDELVIHQTIAGQGTVRRSGSVRSHSMILGTLKNESSRSGALTSH